MSFYFQMYILRMAKVCNKCKLEKETSEFKICRRKKDGLTGSCKNCMCAYEREKYRARKLLNNNISPKSKVFLEVKNKVENASFIVKFDT